MSSRNGYCLKIIALGTALGDFLVRLHVSQFIFETLARYNCRRRGGLAMVDVPDGSHVDVRLGTLKFFPSHLTLSHKTLYQTAFLAVHPGITDSRNMRLSSLACHLDRQCEILRIVPRAAGGA